MLFSRLEPVRVLRRGAGRFRASSALALDRAPLVVFDHRTGTLRPTTVGEIASRAF